MCSCELQLQQKYNIKMSYVISKLMTIDMVMYSRQVPLHFRMTLVWICDDDCKAYRCCSQTLILHFLPLGDFEEGSRMFAVSIF